jgi:phenylacetate-CoA ligase
MVIALLRYYLSLHYWHRAGVDAIKAMQLSKFKELFAYAGRRSKFYREYYGDHGVLGMKIRNFEDVAKIPTVSKALLKACPTKDIMTRRIDARIHIHSTSGSTGEPFKIAFDRYEDYTSHVRVFWALRRAGYKVSDRIVIVSRYGVNDQFGIEKDVSIIGQLQNKLGLFQREIISIYESVDDIIAKLSRTKARILWSTPSIMQIVGNRMMEKGVRFDFPLVFFTSEEISPRQRELFGLCIGRSIVNLYGAMESPSLGFDFGLKDRFTIFPNSNYFEFANVFEESVGEKVAGVIITNLINKTMPIIRYDLNDLVEIEPHEGFGCHYLKRIIGRQDDILKLSNGTRLAHHHVYEMFKDFHECEMYRFVQKADGVVVLQLKVAPRQDHAAVEKMACARWQKRFADVPLAIEFVDAFAADARTGKFKNIERIKRQDRPAVRPEA